MKMAFIDCIFIFCSSYQSTLLYRELKLRSAILSSGHLKLLLKEQVYSTFGGIWNLSSDQGNLGTFIVTNVRLIWYADVNETFNISLPFMQIASVCLSIPIIPIPFVFWLEALLLYNCLPCLTCFSLS